MRGLESLKLFVVIDKKHRSNRIEFQTNGTKREMHDWQHEKILDYKTNNNEQRPRLNKSD